MSTWGDLAQGKGEGLDLGIGIGIKLITKKITIRLFQRSKSVEEIADIVELPIEKVNEIVEQYKQSLSQNN
jgi:NADH:ubiquinone oxidoreductase subunit E